MCLAGCGCRACFVAFFTCGMPHTSAGSYDFASHPTISECSSISAFLSREHFQHKRFRAGLQTPCRLKGTDLFCEQNFVDIFGSRDGFALRAEAGVILCGTYTSKRWSCLQRLKPGSLKLTADALHGTSWKQKSKKKRRTVAALSFCAWRSGISLDDWAGT